MYDSISEALVNSLNEETADLASDLLDDSLELMMTDHSPFSRIPIISFAISTYKFGHTVSELHHLRQLWRFIQELNNETVSDKKREKYVMDFLRKDRKARNNELEYIVLITSKYIDKNKPFYLAKLYLSYVYNDITWEMFVLFSEILDRLLPGDLNVLQRGNQDMCNDGGDLAALLRLSGLGLIAPAPLDIEVPFAFSMSHVSVDAIQKYQMTLFGNRLRECLGF